MGLQCIENFILSLFNPGHHLLFVGSELGLFRNNLPSLAGKATAYQHRQGTQFLQSGDRVPHNTSPLNYYILNHKP